MCREVIIIGAGGHGKVIADIVIKSKDKVIGFLDDSKSVDRILTYPVLGKSADAMDLDADIIIGIGNAGVRKRIQESVDENRLVTLIHPDDVVAENVVIGTGMVVMAGAVINPGTHIGKGCIINTCSSVDHDCVVGDYVHIASGIHLCGTVTVGDGTWIGVGATVSNNVSICSDCMIGAGTVIVSDIKKSGT